MTEGLNDLEERVVGFLAKNLDVDRTKLTPDKELVRHFHLRPEDVGELLGLFSAFFGVDLGRLEIYWRLHFPEGDPMDWMNIFGLGACVIIGGTLSEVIGRGPMWLWIIGLVALWWIVHRFFWPYRDPDPVAITVQDLIDAARERKWVKVYPE